MAGSQIVNANMAGWSALTQKACEAAMDMHIKRSQAFAKTSHRWEDRSGAATSSIQSDTQIHGPTILSTIYGDIETNLYLEKTWFFSGRYAIIEKARNENLPLLWAALRSIMRGTGFGLKIGR